MNEQVPLTIEQGVELRTEYNLLHEALVDLHNSERELWEKSNPIDMIFVRGTIDKLQETRTSNLGFKNVRHRTGELGVAPLSSTAEGFAKTYTTETWQGGFAVGKQLLEDQNIHKARTNAQSFVRAWKRDDVYYHMAALSSAFGVEVEYAPDPARSNEVLNLKITSADTKSGKISDTTQNPLFYKNHTCVLRKGATLVTQSNIFAITDGTTKYLPIAGAVAGTMSNYAVGDIIYIGPNKVRATVTGGTATTPTITLVPNQYFTVNVAGAALTTTTSGSGAGMTVTLTSRTSTLGLDIAGNDPAAIAKLADAINIAVTKMENLLDDNGEPMGVIGAKSIVSANDPHLVSALHNALNTETFNMIGNKGVRNPGYQRIENCNNSVYFQKVPQLANGTGFFIVDKGFQAQNSGLESTNRVAYALNAEFKKNPYGLWYDARERSGVNNGTWQGISYVYMGTGSADVNAWDYVGNFTPLGVLATLVKPITVVGEVKQA